MKQLTIIIPFRNEGEQVYKTCESFNAHSNPEQFNILCLNDSSDDGYDYTQVVKFPNVTLIDNPERLGVAGSRDKGAKLAQTPYILIVDGHMRIFSDVVTPLLEKLHAYPGTLLCCQSQIIRKNPALGTYEIERRPLTKGVRLKTTPGLQFLTYDWDLLTSADTFSHVIPIQCCMGACYAISREYYLHLHGLNGLQQWGMDEQFLSAKVWMSGGKVLLLKNIEIAHIYRSGTPIPYRSLNYIKLLNQFIVVYLLADESAYLAFKKSVETTPFYQSNPEMADIFADLVPFLIKERTYLSLIMKHTFNDFLNLRGNGKL